MKNVTMLIMVMVLTPVCVFAQATFSTKTDFVTLTRPYGIAIGDLNQDGRADIIIGFDNNNKVSIFINTTVPGASTPTFATRTDLTTLSNAYSVCLADINGDGKLDIAALNQGTIGVFLNTTTPGETTATFGTRADFSGGGYWGITAADFNGDGKPDLAATSQGGFASVLFNTTTTGASTPTFATKTNYTTGAYPTSIAAADFNMDGKPDFVVSNDDNGANGNDVSVFLNTAATGASSPSFSARTDFACQINPTTVVAGDLNNDGKPDMAVSNSGSSTISVFFNTTSPGASTPTFTTGATFATGSGPFSVFLADFNLDGKPDLLAADINVSKVSVLLNTTTNGSTTASFATKTDFTTAANPYYASAGDFNGDGKYDIISTNNGGTSISLLMNTMTTGVTTPAFLSASNFTTGNNPSGIVIKDFNKDGLMDIAASNFSASNFSVLLNTTTVGGTTPAYSKTDFSTDADPSAIDAADFNGDGKPDVVVTIRNSTKASIYMNTTTVGAGTPTFSSATDFTTGALPQFVKTADFNGDGKPDFCTANDNTTNTISVFFNTTTPGASTPTFTAKTDISTSVSPFAMILQDVNGDGKKDIVTAINSNPGKISVFINQTTSGSSTPTFSSATDFTVGNDPHILDVADLNGDGMPDFAVANYSSENISVLFNTTSPGASTPSFSAKSDFSASSGSTPYGLVIYDVNSDGKKDLVTTAGTSTTVSVFTNSTAINNSTPSFSTRTDFGTGTNPQSIAFAEMNGDGKPDIVVCNNGSDNISVFLNSAELPLPVELVSFSANVSGSTAALVWSTATEVNNYGFEIERKDKSQTTQWTTLGFVPGAGNSNSEKKYSFTDISLPFGEYIYRLKQIDTDGTFEYSEEIMLTIGIPNSFSLAQNYPNPFNPGTTIHWSLSAKSKVTLSVYSAVGEKIAVLLNEEMTAGQHDIVFDASSFPSGVYFYTLTAGEFASTKSMVLLK